MKHCCSILREGVGHLAGIHLCPLPCGQHLWVLFLANGEALGCLEVSLCSQSLFATFEDCYVVFGKGPGQSARLLHFQLFAALPLGRTTGWKGLRCSSLVLVLAPLHQGRPCLRGISLDTFFPSLQPSMHCCFRLKEKKSCVCLRGGTPFALLLCAQASARSLHRLCVSHRDHWWEAASLICDCCPLRSQYVIPALEH